MMSSKRKGAHTIRLLKRTIEPTIRNYHLFIITAKMNIMTDRPHSTHQDSTQQHPEPNVHKKNISQLAQMLAQFLDASLTIPGTTIKFGLDPLIGLIPGIGDLISNGIGSSLLFLATKAGVPRIVILRMSFNIVINMVIGAIPVIGDLFSIWFKSNLQNAQLLHRHSQTTTPVTTVIDWMYVSIIVIAMILLLSLTFSLIYWVSSSLLSLLGLTE